MTYSPDYELRKFTKRRAQTVLNVARQGAPDNVGGALVLALMSRETNLRNICGGGYFDNGDFTPTYQDHGLAQISEIYWEAWLKAHKGCVEGTYQGTQPHVLSKPRLVPRLTDQSEFVCAHLDGNIVQARKAGAKDPKRVGIAGYNCGLYTAIHAERDYGDPDRHTTHGNYSTDILAREKTIKRWLNKNGWAL